MNILVLAGGLSPERDVSLSSGSKIASALIERGHRVAMVDVYMDLGELPRFSDEPIPPCSAAETEPDLDALRAAVSAGADAVYFGAEKFSARARAKNLSSAEMAKLFGECRARGVRTHGALNIRMRTSELSEALSLAEEMFSLGVDALIVADAGLAQEILRRFPEAELHASTQIT